MADEEKESATSPLAKAVDRIRASAQALLTAFAGVGVALAAGLQLGDVGDLSLDDDPVRMLVAFGGIGMGVLGIALAIASSAAVSTKSNVSLRWLIQNANSDAATEIDADVALRQGISLTDLQTRLSSGLTAAAATYDAIVQLGDPGDDAAKKAEARALRTQYDQQMADIEHLRRVRTDVLDVASFFRTKQAYDDAKGKVVAGAVIAALGITAFAWGANGPSTPSIDPGEVLPKTPSEVTVVLTQKGRQEFGARLGATCDPAKVAAVAFEVTGETYKVTTERTEDCKSAHLAVSPELGRVIPRVADSASVEQKPAGVEDE